ncbi:hypothetical protein Ancab_007033, partial [Ancistrocladus abbreviatus]
MKSFDSIVELLEKILVLLKEDPPRDQLVLGIHAVKSTNIVWGERERERADVGSNNNKNLKILRQREEQRGNQKLPFRHCAFSQKGIC